MSAISSEPTTGAPEPAEWWKKPLAELSPEQWEALCDGCGKCCLHKLQDDETDEIHYTNIACRLLDLGSCKCSNYPARWRFVPDCIGLSYSQLSRMTWLPSTCAYKLRNEGKDLAWWHHLVSGDPESVHKAGISVRGRCIPEQKAGHPEDHIVTWPE